MARSGSLFKVLLRPGMFFKGFAGKGGQDAPQLVMADVVGYVGQDFGDLGSPGLAPPGVLDDADKLYGDDGEGDGEHHVGEAVEPEHRQGDIEDERHEHHQQVRNELVDRGAELVRVDALAELARRVNAADKVAYDGEEHQRDKEHRRARMGVEPPDVDGFEKTLCCFHDLQCIDGLLDLSLHDVRISPERSSLRRSALSMRFGVQGNPCMPRFSHRLLRWSLNLQSCQAVRRCIR